MQLENGLLHHFVLFDLEWEHFLVWRYSKINNDPHLGKTRFKMALDHYDEVIWVNLFCRSVSTQQNLRIKIILILLRSKMKKTSIQTLAKFTNVLILTFYRKSFTLFLCFSYG